ncbi:MAG: B12-binding domain-containing protein, partial [Candidatus Bathyarchaeia archaeon]
MSISDKFVNVLADLKEEEALKIVEERLNTGEDPFKILEDVRRAMETVGNRFANNEYFISDLLYAGEILRAITEKIKPRLAT